MMQSGFAGIVRCTVHVRTDSSDRADVDDNTLGFDQERVQEMHNSHGSKDVDSEHLFYLGNLGVCCRHRVTCNWEENKLSVKFQV